MKKAASRSSPLWRSALTASATTTTRQYSKGQHGHQHDHKTGILAIETYFPSTYVSQEELEEYDGVGKGKYTVGLGQHNMAVCTVAEDINSISLTAVKNLMEKNFIKPNEIGRLEVGTETVIDKSKSVKSTLMDLFKESKNYNIEGVDTTNACYGGTNALFNALNWVESGNWDGRYAIVVAADIAVYEKGPARPTGGAGAVAMLIGPNAPINFEHGLRSSYFENAYDFYKPVLSSEYPVVDGKLSNECYLRALDNCYFGYKGKFDQHFHGHRERFDLDLDVDYALFHSPYTKLVQKSWARLAFLEFITNRHNKKYGSSPLNSKEFHSFFKADGSVDLEATYDHKELMKVLLKESDASYRHKVLPSLRLGMELGNSYCGSLYCGIQSLISHMHKHKVETTGQGKRALLFSYGSGLAATLFSMKIQGDISKIAEASAFEDRLKKRVKLAPSLFEGVLTTREEQHAAKNLSPKAAAHDLFPGTYYLSNIDDKFRRSYERV